MHLIYQKTTGACWAADFRDHQKNSCNAGALETARKGYEILSSARLGPLIDSFIPVFEGFSPKPPNKIIKSLSALVRLITWLPFLRSFRPIMISNQPLFGPFNAQYITANPQCDCDLIHMFDGDSPNRGDSRVVGLLR